MKTETKSIYMNITFSHIYNKLKQRSGASLCSAMLIVLMFAAASCSKEEGEGGTSSVTGKVYVLDYNDSYTLLESSYYGMDRDVFIVYGDDVVYGDKTSTHFDGTFRFENLRKGKYTVYSYSEDTTSLVAGGEYPVLLDFEITENAQELVLPDLIVVR